MRKKLFAALVLLGQSYVTQAAEYVDWVNWDEIEHWAGDPDGEKKCALVIDFQDGQTGQSLVWGYRWNGTKTGEDLVRDVASQSSILTAMIQYTGTMGSTLNALGISAAREELDYLHYDFDRAAIGGEVSFGFFEPNLSMGQEVAPGYDAEQMCINAIERAKSTGIIEHPLNAFLYGYPAYDYDYWQLEEGYADSFEYRWRSGWYDGYWSYWHGPNDYDYMSYSGLGMSSTVLTDGGVQAWKYIVFNGGGSYGDAGGELAEELDYSMADWGEEMHEAPEVIQPVDQSNVTFWVGSGEKAATVVFQFNDGKGPENLVYGYRWSGGWDDNLSTVVSNIAKADPRMNYEVQNGKITVTYDSNQDGSLGTIDHTSTENTWNCYVKRVVDDGFNKVPAGRWLNPNAVMIFSHQASDVAEVALPYQLFRPALDAEQLITVPSVIDYALADENLQLPLFVQVPEGGKLSTAFNWVKDTELNNIISTATVTDLMGRVTAYKNFAEKTGTVQIRGSYTPAGSSKAEYVFSNDSEISLNNPIRPITAVTFEQSEITARLNHAVENPMVYEPQDATYTKFNYQSSNTKVATATTAGIKTTKVAGESTITATYDFNADLKASYNLESMLMQQISDITFEGADDDNVITLTPKEMTGLIPIFTPEDPDIPEMNVVLTDNGADRNSYIATMYKVNLWDKDNNRTTPYELSGHRLGECTLTATAADGSGFEKTFTVRVVEPEREPAIDYNTGTIMLNEEWFGHTNGGLNWFSPDYEVVYQAYERENPGMSFGCTSQYGIIYDNKLVVSSKQATDGGDPLPGGGRLVVADASTLKRIGSIDDIKIAEESKSNDGRALCGAGPGRVYMGTNNGIYIIDINNCEILGKIAAMGEQSSNLYSGQIGDMVLAGTHAFAIKQSTGVIIIDIETDNIVKEIPDVNVQGITQSADGSVWYATKVDNHSVFVALDLKTLEEIERVDVPLECGVVTCGWGAWRTTQFTGAYSVNSLFFSGGSSIANGGNGEYYRYDIDEKIFRPIATVSGLPAHTQGLKQGAYGTIRYDDRSKEIIAGTTENKASGHYRYNWTHFINAETGEFNKSVELRPYYWFQSMPIFPDAFEPEVESIDDVVLYLTDEQPTEITINATDRDNNDANIHYSLVDVPQTYGDANVETPTDVKLIGNKLILTPLTDGSQKVCVAVESNGKTVNHEFLVTTYQSINDGVESAVDEVASISCNGRTVVITGCQGVGFDIVNTCGVTIESFTAASDNHIQTLNVAPGVYVIVADNGLSKKIIVK